MTQCTKLLMTVGIVVTFAHSARAEVIEFTKDNPDTLVGTDPGSYEVYGLRLGMTHEEAWKVIHAAGNLMGEKDQFALERIHVYPIGQGGEKGKRVLYLIWETASPHMHELSITRDCAPFLAPNFAKLLTSQSAEKNSEFRMRFLGTGSRDTVDEQAKRSGIDHRVFSHEEIGVQVHTTQALRDRVPPSFAIRLTTPTRQATISETTRPPHRVREWTDNTGSFRIRATLVEVDGTKATLRKEDQTEIVVPVSRLSDVDRKYLEESQ